MKGKVLLIIILLGSSLLITTSMNTYKVIPQPDSVSMFGMKNGFLYKLDVSPTDYQSPEHNITLGEYQLNIYDHNLTLVRQFDIPDRYEDAQVRDITEKYILMHFRNDSNDRIRKIFDVDGNNVLDPDLLPDTEGYIDFTKLINDTIIISYLSDEFEPNTYKIMSYNFTSNELIDTDSYDMSIPETSNFGELREMGVSSPIKFNSTTYNVRQTATYYASDDRRKMTVNNYFLNTETGKMSSASFSSSICDPRFSDKQGQVNSYSGSNECYFFPDYVNKQIYYVRLMVLDSDNTVIHVTLDDTELAAVLEKSYDWTHSDQYKTDGAGKFSLFFIEYDTLYDNKLNYVNLYLDFTNGTIKLHQDTADIKRSEHYLITLNSDFSNMSFYQANLESISVQHIDGITPQPYTPPENLYQTKSTTTINFMIPVLIAIVIPVLFRKQYLK